MMADIHTTVVEILARFEGVDRPFSEHDISASIKSVTNGINWTDLPLEVVAEQIAFDFMEDFGRHESGWSTHFGPMMVMQGPEGLLEYPSIKQVTPDIISYWLQRANNASHPVIRARYADLVWDLCFLVTGEKANYRMAQIAVDSIVEMASKKCHDTDVDIIGKLGRALSIAISLNDQTRITAAKDAIIEFEKKVADDKHPGLWGFSFDLLYENSKVILSDKERKSLVDELEARLARVSNRNTPETFDPWATECATLQLARHYRKIGLPDEMKRVLLVYGGAYAGIAKDASAMLASGWLENVHKQFLEFGLNEEAKIIAARIQELGSKVISEMKHISTEFTVPKHEMQAHIDEMNAGNLEEVLIRIALNYFPKRADVESRLKEVAKEHPLQFLISTQVIDHKGRPGLKIGSIENDPAGQVIKQMSQELQIINFFMWPTFQETKRKFCLSVQLLADYIFKSPIFDRSRRPIIEAGIAAWLGEDHLTCAHILIPQIEEAIRNLVQRNGGAVYTPERSSDGGYRLRMLGDLLRDQLFIDVFDSDMAFYLSVLLCDQRGLNLRNSICHGFMNPEQFGHSVSDRMVHVLLILALVKEK
jgi:hypothetical protein